MRAIITTLLIATLAISSCSYDIAKSLDKAKSEAEKSKDPTKQAIPAEKCHLWYPVKSDSSQTSKIIPGETKASETEFVYVPYDCDSALDSYYKDKNRSIHDTFRVKFPVKVPVYLRVDTNLIIHNIVKKDSAQNVAQSLRIQALNQEIKKRDDKIAKTDGQISKLTGQRNWGWGLLLLLIIAILTMLYLTKRR
jgi:hypothetical protein